METDVQNAIDSARSRLICARRALQVPDEVSVTSQNQFPSICVTLWLLRLFLYCESNNNNGTRTTQKAARPSRKVSKKENQVYIAPGQRVRTISNAEPRFIYAHKYI